MPDANFSDNQTPIFTRLKITGKKFYRQGKVWIIFLSIILIVFILRQCVPAPSPHKSPIAVVAASAKRMDVPVYLDALGSVTPIHSVTVKTQVEGVLSKVFFKEGQLVQTGQILAEIDDRPYEAQLIQYQGQLTRDEALLANALLDLKRYRKLWRQNAVSKQTLDTQTALVKQDKGTVTVDQGQLQNAKVNLSYCKITASVTGLAGLRLIDPGNIVQPTDTSGLVIINTLSPITAVFSIPEDDLPQVLKSFNSGLPVIVKAYDRTQQIFLAMGKLLTIDNQIDPGTGTIKLKAVFINKNKLLFPNQFINLKILVNTLHNAVVIPTAAIQQGPQTAFVYVINFHNNTVNIASVIPGIAIGDQSAVTGLSAGQSVVISGADKLTDGAHVAVSPISSSKITQASAKPRDSMR